MTNPIFQSFAFFNTQLKFYLKRKFIYIIGATSLLSLLFLSGCATLQSPYPKKMQETKSDIIDNKIQKASSTYLDDFSKDSNPNLYLLELGRINQLDKKNKDALNQYAQVIHSIQQERMKAKIQVSKILSNAGAIATSDLELSYSVPDYEQTFLYAYQAQNYLALDDLSNALVSIRQLSQAQAWTQMQYDIAKEGQKKVDQDYSQYQINQDLDLSKHKPIYDMQSQVKHIANAYENGFAFYLAAILYEAYGYDYNDAYISIKNAYRLLPENNYVQETLNQMKQGFDGNNPFGKTNGRLVVLYESGLVNTKRSFYLPLFLGKLGLQNIAIPYYSTENNQITSFPITVITSRGKVIQSAQSALLTDTNLLAAKSLSEQYPAIITREVLRLIFKATATYQLQKEAGLGGLIAGSVYNFMTTKADLRSWLLLPRTVELYESLLSQGNYIIHTQEHQISLKINPQKTTLVWITQIGQFFEVHAYYL